MTGPVDQPARRRFDPAFRWEGVELKEYKEDGRALFKDVTRQVLFSRPDLAGELRYFEVAAGGHTTLERHQHVHAVLILRGHGQALVGHDVVTYGPNDLITVPPMTWHQFRAASDGPMGFLCMVDAVRDKPQLPTPDEVADLMSNATVASFLAGQRT